MTRDDIIAWARESEVWIAMTGPEKQIEEERLERFAHAAYAAGAKAEREACAAIARKWDVDHPTTNYGGCIANEIIARGQK